MASYALGMMFAKPIPLHALRPSSVAAVEAMREAGRQRRHDAVMAQIVTDVGRPRLEPYEAPPEVRVRRADGRYERIVTGAPRPIDPVTAGARSLAKLAADAGFTVQTLVWHDGCRVEGHHPSRVGFRASWVRGVADAASWHEPWRYEMVTDEREIAVDQKAHVGKVGYRSPGVGTTHLSIAGTPWGKRTNVTTVRARIQEVASQA